MKFFFRSCCIFLLSVTSTMSHSEEISPSFDNENLWALFAVLPIKVLAHESGHYLGIKYLTDSEVRSFKYRLWFGRVSADPSRLAGLGDASAAVLPAMASDRFLTKVPYRYFYKDGKDFTDKMWRWLAVSSIWPSLYVTSDIILHYTDGGGADWINFVKVWRGNEWSPTHTATLWGIAVLLYADFWFNQKDEVACLLGQIYHFGDCKGSDQKLDVRIGVTSLDVTYRF